MKKILITGSTGFIGSAIANDLKSKYIIYATQRSPITQKQKKNSNIKYLIYKNHSELNIRLKKIKASIVIHCATHYVKNHKFSDIQKIINANIEFGNILLENIGRMKTKKFINFSTVWEDYDGKQNNLPNLYSASKKAFRILIDYYYLNYKNTKFYNIFIPDTYGENDKRRKLINLLKQNYNKNKTINFLSKNLYINLLNVKDILQAVRLLLNKNINSGKYTLTNKNKFKLSYIIKKITKIKIPKCKFRWISSRIIKEKIYKNKKLPGWKPQFSDINYLAEFITK